MLLRLTNGIFSNLSVLRVCKQRKKKQLGFYDTFCFPSAVLASKDKNHSAHAFRSGRYRFKISWCLCVSMLGHGTRNVEKHLLLVLLWLVSMMAMIGCTCNRQAHYLRGSSTIPSVWWKKRVFRNSIRGVHCTKPQPLNSTFEECHSLMVLIFSPL